MQFQQIFQYFFIVAVFFFFLFDFSHGGGCGVALLAAEVGLVVVDLDFGFNLLLEIAAEAMFYGVELLLTDGLDPGGLGLGAHAEIVRIVGLVMVELDQP